MTDLSATAREAVLRQLSLAYDRHAEEAQILIYEGRYDEAQAEYALAGTLLLAYNAERRADVRGNLTYTLRTDRP